MNKLLSLIRLKLQDIFNPTKVCTTRMVNDQFFECKVKKPSPKYCQHSLSSGDGFICRHEDRKSFAAK